MKEIPQTECETVADEPEITNVLLYTQKIVSAGDRKARVQEKDERFASDKIGMTEDV